MRLSSKCPNMPIDIYPIHSATLQRIKAYWFMRALCRQTVFADKLYDVMPSLSSLLSHIFADLSMNYSFIVLIVQVEEGRQLHQLSPLSLCLFSFVPSSRVTNEVPPSLSPLRLNQKEWGREKGKKCAGANEKWETNVRDESLLTGRNVRGLSWFTWGNI